MYIRRRSGQPRTWRRSEPAMSPLVLGLIISVIAILVILGIVVCCYMQKRRAGKCSKVDKTNTCQTLPKPEPRIFQQHSDATSRPEHGGPVDSGAKPQPPHYDAQQYGDTPKRDTAGNPYLTDNGKDACDGDESQVAESSSELNPDRQLDLYKNTTENVQEGLRINNKNPWRASYAVDNRKTFYRGDIQNRMSTVQEDDHDAQTPKTAELANSDARLGPAHAQIKVRKAKKALGGKTTGSKGCVEDFVSKKAEDTQHLEDVGLDDSVISPVLDDSGYASGDEEYTVPKVNHGPEQDKSLQTPNDDILSRSQMTPKQADQGAIEASQSTKDSGIGDEKQVLGTETEKTENNSQKAEEPPKDWATYLTQGPLGSLRDLFG